MSIALIPARGGSKRIPRKNIKYFHGKPIIAYSIEAAQKSGCFDRIIVSTDDAEIADIAQQHGAEVPFLRPDDLSNDTATTLDVIRHGLAWAENDAGSAIDNICCIYATAPFLKANDLSAAFQQHQSANAAYTFSATEFSFPPQRGFILNNDDAVEPFQSGMETIRSQDIAKVYHDAGQFYWCRRKALLANMPIFAPQSRAHLMPRERVQDIDTPEDWSFAEKLYALGQNGASHA